MAQAQSGFFFGSWALILFLILILLFFGDN
ncbi:hypothetical protein Tph_c28500 [Thermacetogenium phaeum DSM 12270]|jgi:hypothetical protein|uniref:Uncharacterized protein n=1 Tax=Thermacetogenium phaeum (strain ATCC BAA-254 / DSM 26808 / PB) TaxID=1089553 RepID=K4LM15_THEPS|nr:hypothetical protein Tph_c28500 [Thermacetogenium phaeum DSM 12270]